MRRLTSFTLLGATAVTAGTLVAGLAARADAAPGTARAAMAGAPVRATASRCRTADLHPTSALTARVQICGSYLSSGRWAGAGTVHLTAAAPVSGVTIGYPLTSVQGFATREPFTLRAGQTRDVEFGRTEPAGSDTAVTWALGVIVSGTSVQQMTYAPTVRRTSAVAARSTQKGLLVNYQEAQGTDTGTARVSTVHTRATYLGNGTLALDPTALTYRSTHSVKVALRQRFGSRQVLTTFVTLPATGGRDSTVTLAGATVDVLAGEERLGERTITFDGRTLTSAY